MSAVGNDEFGRQILTDAKAAGIDVSGVSVNPELMTASYTAVHDSTGELLHAISDMRIFDQFVLPAFETIEPIIAAADAIVLDANLPEAVLGKIGDACKGKTLVADSVSRQKCKRLYSLLGSVTLLKANRAEAMTLTNSEDDTDEALLSNLHQLGPAQLLISAGDDGVVYSGNSGMHRMSVVPDINVVSTTGAGDALLSGVLAAQLYGADVAEQLRWGTIAAAETVGVHSACAQSISRQLLSR